jgi:RNA polymerase sigma factor (sigma-70 family)
MSESLINRLVKHLRVAAPSAGDLPTDGELLDRYQSGRDEAAFELLVRRHGAMVLGVCRRTLADSHAAEDAFQATFLVLARKACSVRRATVAGWLYRVALRIALRARQGVARRAGREQPLVEEPAVAGPDQLAGQDLRAVLDDELRLLPERFRLPVLLCYVEGHTTEQAAQLLGCPRGTILSRLATARHRLSTRLLRRGITVSGAGLTATLAEPAWPAGVPEALAEAAVRGAFSLSGTPIPVVHLTEGVIHAMFLSKLRWTVGVVLFLGILGIAGSQLAFDAPAQGQDRPQAIGSPKPERPREQPKEALQQEARAQLERAREELTKRSDQLAMIEHQHSQETLDLRLKLLTLEEELRGLERTRDAELANHRQRIKLAETDPRRIFGDLPAEIDYLSRLLDQIRQLGKPDQAKVEALQKDLAMRRNQLANETDELRTSGVKIEKRFAQESIRLRKEILTVEEELRLRERRASRSVGFAEAEVTASANRVRQLEGLPAAAGLPSRPIADLDRQLGQLLREVGELRKEVKRLREGK